jgi:hypothetical protein
MKALIVIMHIIVAHGSLQVGASGEALPVPIETVPAPDLDFGSIEELEAGLSQGFVAADVSGWVKEFDHVDVVVYDGDPDVPLIVAGRFNRKYASRLTKRLDGKETELLTKCVSGKHKPMWKFMCFDPHHAFVFYDKGSKALAQIEICFDCNTFRSSPESGLSEYWDLESIKKLILGKGLPVFETSKEWEEYFSKLSGSAPPLQSEEAEQAGAGQPATRSQSKSEGGDKPQPEAEGRSR